MSEFEERAAQYRAQALALMQMSEREIDAAQKSNVAGDGFDLQEDGRTGRRNSATRRQADLRNPRSVPGGGKACGAGTATGEPFRPKYSGVLERAGQNHPWR